MRTSSNPAFRNLPGGQGGATLDRQGGMMGGAAAYTDAAAGQVQYGRAAPGERLLTVDDVVTKTAICAAIALVTGVLTAVSGLYFLVLPAFIIGLVVSLILIFKQSTNPALVLTYSAAMGVALGGITGMLENIPNFEGIGFQAVVGTAGVFVGMLVIYKTGAVRVTPKFTKWLMGALIGVVVLMVFNLLFSFFTTGGLGPARRVTAGLPVQHRLHRRRRVQPAARLRHGRPRGQGRRAGEVRLVHRVRPDDHAGLALHRDPAAAELLPGVT